MSWTFTLGLCSTNFPETLNNYCAHDRARAADIIRSLGLIEVFEIESSLDDALGLPPKHIAVGAYKDIVIISDPAYLLGPTSGALYMRVHNVPVIPSARVLCAQSAGIVGYSSYVYWNDGVLVRRFRADPDKGVINFGGLLAVEAGVIMSVCVENGEISFVVHRNGRNEKVSPFDCGTELTFAMMSMFLGVSYDTWRGDSPIVSVFKIRGTNDLWRSVDVRSDECVW